MEPEQTKQFTNALLQFQILQDKDLGNDVPELLLHKHHWYEWKPYKNMVKDLSKLLFISVVAQKKILTDQALREKKHF